MVSVFETYTRLMRERVLSGSRFWYRLEVLSNFLTIELKTDQLAPRGCTLGRNFCVGMCRWDLRTPSLYQT